MKNHSPHFFDQIERLQAGDPPPTDSGLFGASFSREESKIMVIPVPWDATTSFRPGAGSNFEAIRLASHQLDLEDPILRPGYRHGFHCLSVPEDLVTLNKQVRPLAERVIRCFEENRSPNTEDQAAVNKASQQVNDYVYQQAKMALQTGQLCGVLGGDHSSPFGLIKALWEEDPNFGILHIDAHHDLRSAYEGFRYSHASIMHCVMTELPGISRLVSVGIRDYSKVERQFAANHPAILTQYDDALQAELAAGRAFEQICQELLDQLPQRVYISFDIDGLSAELCPTTGTPVPGGISFPQARFLLNELATKKDIIGFDLCEVGVAQDGWDQNVGARVLYKLICTLAHGLNP